MANFNTLIKRKQYIWGPLGKGKITYAKTTF